MKQIKDQLRNQLLPASMFKLMIITIEGPLLHEWTLTATVERSFSDMKQIKDRLHNRLLPASMFKLMIIAIEGSLLHEWTLTATVERSL